MNARTVAVLFRAEIAQFKRDVVDAAGTVKTVATAAQDVGKRGAKGFGDLLDSINKNDQQLSELSTKVGLVGIGLTGMAALAVKKFADFDQAMSGVAATGEDARQSINQLREAAIAAGADTVYSATESANAITELAKAGISTADILRGGLKGALSLAAAGGIEVADAASIAAATMNQFGLTGDKASHVADVLAASAGKANGEVSDFGVAMKYVGPVAASLDITLEQTAGTLALLAQNGILADNAGTGLRGVLMAMSAPSKDAQKALAEYNITAFDASGKFIGLTGLVGQLHDKLGGLTDAERSAALGRIFGNAQITTANILMKAGASEVEKWTAAVDDQGYAAEVARIKLDNLRGDIEKLSGSFDTVLIESGSGANDVLRQLVQTAEALVDAIGSIPTPVLSAITIIAGVAGLAALGVAGLTKLTLGFAAARTAAQALGISAGVSRAAVVGVGLALGIATIAVMHWASEAAKAKARTDAYAESLDEFGNRTEATTRIINDALAGDRNDSFLGKLLGKDPESLIDQAKRFGLEVKDLQGYIAGNADAIKRVNDAVPSSWLQQTAATKSFKNALNDQADALTDAEKKTAQKTLADEEAGVAAEGVAGSTQVATAATEAYTAATEEASKALLEWRKMVGEADASFIDIQGAYDAVIDKQKAVAESSAADSKSSKDSWEDFYDGTSVSADQYIAKLQEQVDAQSAWETNMLDLTRRVKDGMTGDMASAANQMIDEVLQLGPKGAAQVQLLHDMSDEQFAKVVELWSQRGVDAVTDFTAQVEAYRQPVITPTIDPSVAYSQLATLQGNLNRAAQKNVPIPYQADLQRAAGSIDTAVPMAMGALNSQLAQFVPPGTPRIVGDRMDVDEAFIPLDGSKRSWGLLSEAFTRMPGGNGMPARYAKNGSVNGRASSGAVSGAAMGGSAGIDPSSLAEAFSGMAFTLMIDGQPVRAIARAESTSVLRASAGRAR